MLSEAQSAQVFTKRYWLELLGMLVVVLLVSKIWQAMGVTALSLGTTTVSLTAAFVVGLVAAVSSCMALVGGLLLSISATWSEQTEMMSPSARLRPLAFFNVGRLAGYFVLGGLIGLLGKTINPGGQITGYVTIALSLVMIWLALRILKLLPKKFCGVQSGKLYQVTQTLAKSRHPAMPLLLGAITFFVPCGFTQSMQLLALGTGNFMMGGLLMFAFALGTMPSLLGISFASAYLRGAYERYFLLFSGVAVLLLGFHNVQSGLLLTGVDAQGFIEQQFFSSVSRTHDPYVTTDANGKQIISMYVTPQGYKPDHFTIDANKETWIYAIANNPPAGCATFMQIPTLGASAPIRQGANWLGPVFPQKNFVITCSQGILRADVQVRGS